MSVVATTTQFKENAHEALTDDRLQGAMSFSRNFVDRRAAAAGTAARVRGAARQRQGDQGSHARPPRPLSRGLRAEGSRERRPSPLRAGRRGGAQDHHRPLQVDGREKRHQGQVDDRRRRSASTTRSRRRASSRSKPTSASTSFNCAAKRPPTSSRPAIHLTAKDVEQEFRKAHGDLLPERSLAEPEQLLAEARAGAAGQIPGRRRRDHGRELPDRRNRNLDHRHQRRQRRPDANPARGAHRHRLARENRADAGGRCTAPARAGALGDRAGRLGLYDALDRAAPAGRSGRSQGLSCRAFSTTAAHRCWAASSRTCCAASAAAPA